MHSGGAGVLSGESFLLFGAAHFAARVHDEQGKAQHRRKERDEQERVAVPDVDAAFPGDEPGRLNSLQRPMRSQGPRLGVLIPSLREIVHTKAVLRIVKLPERQPRRWIDPIF